MELTRKHITWGSIVAAAAGISTVIAFWDDIGGPVPLTKHSPVVEALHETDRVYRDIFQIQELEVSRLDAEIITIKIDSLYERIETLKFLLTQFDGMTTLSPGQTREKIRWETQIERHTAQIDRLEGIE